MKIFEFQKERSLDTIIEASFKLLRKHFKPMFSILWKYNAPIIIAFFASYFLYFYLFFGQFNNLMRNITVPNYNLFSDPKLVVVILILIVTAVIFYPRFYATIMGYIRVYKENNGIVEPEKVNFYIKEKFWGLIGVGLLLSLIVFGIVILGALVFAGFSALGSIGVAFSVFLGIAAFFFVIYASTTVTFAFPLYFFDDVSATDSIKLSFKYIKHKWWFSFWTLFVVGFIIGILGSIVNFPVSIYSALKELSVIKSEEMTTMVLNSGDVIVSILSVLSLIVQYILKTIYLIALSLLFFSLKEYHTQEGILGKIDQIGNNSKNEK